MMANNNRNEDEASVEAFPGIADLIGKKGLKFGHINVNGLVNKLGQIKQLLLESNLGILAVTETHLSKKIEDSKIKIDGYELIRQDRKGKKNSWGGTLIYHKKHINIYELDYDKHMKAIESVWAEIIIKSQTILVGCIYRPPDDKKFLNNLTPILEKYSHRSNIILLGDLNIDLAKDDAYLTPQLHRGLAKVALQNVIKDYTRITENSKTLIDLAIIPVNDTKILRSGSYGSAISDHNLIYVTMNYFIDRPPPKLRTVKDYKNVDQNKLKQDLSQVPWDIVSIFDDVDDSLWAWEELFNGVINEHVQTRKVKVRSKNEPWMTGKIRKLLNNRYKLFKNANGTPKGSPEWKLYKQSRNGCTNAIKAAKAKYWRNEFDKSNNSKSFWKTVKKFNGDTNKCTIGPLADNKRIITDDKEKAELMNSFFANVGKKLALDIGEDHTTASHKQIYKVTPTLSDVKLDFELFEKSFTKAVNIGKACGLDMITAEDLKINESASTTGLFQVLKQSVQTGKFPTNWKIARVSCVFKKGSKRDCSNYRPVSLLSIPSKVVEKFICSQLNDHLVTFNLLNEHQWGFRAARSTEDLLLYLTETWYKALDDKKVVGILMIDFKKAFDSVSHEVLLNKLSACGVSGDFLEFMMSYLKERSQITKVNGVTSTKSSVEYGVPQGSILGPQCFSMYVNDMPDVGDEEIDLYADDSETYSIADTVDEVMINLQKQIELIANYSLENCLTIHPDKCQILILSKQKFIGPLPDVKINNNSIKITDKTKCLGVILDNKLSWGPHTEMVCNAFSNKLKNLYKMNTLDKYTLRTIYNSGILPSVIYGILIWGNCADHLLDDIEKIHIKAARFIERIKKKVKDCEVLAQAKWKPLAFYYKKHLTCKTYKIYNDLTSPLLKDFINKSTKTKRTRNECKIDQPAFNYVGYKRSFAYRASTSWNLLPLCVREKKSLATFKKALLESKVIPKINFGYNSTSRARDPENYLYY